MDAPTECAASTGRSRGSRHPNRRRRSRLDERNASRRLHRLQPSAASSCRAIPTRYRRGAYRRAARTQATGTGAVYASLYVRSLLSRHRSVSSFINGDPTPRPRHTTRGRSGQKRRRPVHAQRRCPRVGGAATFDRTTTRGSRRVPGGDGEDQERVSCHAHRSARQEGRAAG